MPSVDLADDLHQVEVLLRTESQDTPVFLYLDLYDTRLPDTILHHRDDVNSKGSKINVQSPEFTTQLVDLRLKVTLTYLAEKKVGLFLYVRVTLSAIPCSFRQSGPIMLAHETESAIGRLQMTQ